MAKRSTRRRGLFLLFLALLVAIASTWLNGLWIAQKKSESKEAKQSRVSHYFTEFSLMSTDAEGVVEYTLTGRHFSRWSGKDWSEVSEPRLITFEAKKQSNKMTAKKAIMLHKKDVLELHDNVNIKDFNSDPVSVLTTDFLRYYPKKRIINTEATVKFVSGTTVLTGKGMDSKLDENTLRIHSDVHTTFEQK